MSRPLIYYSQWPLGFHNPEGERKAIALSDAGYEVFYVPGVGIRNPRISRARKAAQAGLRKLRGRARVGGGARDRRLVNAPILVLPPRQFPPIRRFNVAWVEHQLRSGAGDLSQALAWIRYPTPELVAALARARPHAVVYECVDSYDHTPGIVGRWINRLASADRALTQLADVVVVPSEALADRFRPRGTAVQVIPHGVDVERFSVSGPRDHRVERAVAGFIGTLDDRLDLPALRHMATERPGWRIRLIGPARDNFDPRDLADLDNVSIEPPVPQALIGAVIAEFDLGLMPYADQPVYRYMCPVKNLEFMAAGKPAVARPNGALEPYRDLLYFAATPAEFLLQAERALREDSQELAQRRRASAESGTWETRLAEVVHLARQLAPP